MSETIFTLKFARAGQKLEFGRESALLRSFHVEDIMEINPETITVDEGFDRILKLFLENQEEHFYVVDEEGGLAGRISIHDVKDVLHDEKLGKLLIAADVLTPVPEVVYRQDNLEDCLVKLAHHDSADLPVLYNPDKPALVGIITRRAIFEVYNREILNQQDTGIQLVTGEARMHDCVELPETYKVQILIPPASWMGKSLQDLALRKRYNISVLAVKKRTPLGTLRNEMPDPERPLGVADRLIIVGEVGDLERLLKDINPRAFGSGLSLSDGLSPGKAE